MHALALSGHSSESSHTDSIPQGPPHFPSVKNTLVRVSSDQYPLRIVALLSSDDVPMHTAGMYAYYSERGWKGSSIISEFEESVQVQRESVDLRQKEQQRRSSSAFGNLTSRRSSTTTTGQGQRYSAGGVSPFRTITEGKPLSSGDSLPRRSSMTPPNV